MVSLSIGRCFNTSILFVLVAFTSFSQISIPHGSVIISHISPDYGLAADEFVVLFNSGADTAELGGYELRYFTSSGSLGSAGALFSGVIRIPPSRHLLLASKETVAVGSATALRDFPLTSGMASTGGQLVLRRTDQPDSLVYAAAWGAISSYVAGMTDAAAWGGDGMLALTWNGTTYVRTGFNASNLQYSHTSVSAIAVIPSLHPLIPPSPWSALVIVRQAGAADSTVSFGMSGVATDTFDIGTDLPAPPPLEGILSAAISRPDLGLATGNRLLRDLLGIRSLSDTFAEWTLVIHPEHILSPVTVDFILTGVPSAMPVRLQSGSSRFFPERRADTVSVEFTPQDLSPFEFSVAVGDTLPPIAQWLEPSMPLFITAGSTMIIRSRVMDGSGLDSVRLVFENRRTRSEIVIRESPLEYDSVSWTLPARLLSDSACVRMDAVDRMGNGRSIWSNPLWIVPDTARRSFTAGWHLVSSPLDPVDPAWTAVGADSSYLFSYVRHVGYRLSDTLQPGRGYFLGLLRPRTVRIVGITAFDSAAIPLSPGFNLISTVHSAPIARSRLNFLRYGTELSHAEALKSGWIGTGVFGFDSGTLSYEDVDSLRPWSGYWIPVFVDNLLCRTSTQASSIGQRVKSGVQDGWRARLLLRGSNAVDSLLVFGTSSSATTGFDAAFDMPAPPPPPTVRPLTAWFDHPEWSLPTGRSFLSDIRSSEENHFWTIMVRAEVFTRVSATWRSEGQTRVDQILVCDQMGNEIRTWSAHDTLTFEVAGTTALSVRPVVTGVHGSSDVPNEFALNPCYPNPFNASTQIVMSVPRRGHLAVTIFDVLGRGVTTLFDGRVEPGVMPLTWTSQVASGIYFVRADYQDVFGQVHRQARRIVLLR